MKAVFGPIISRRFGISLGVDLSPSKKQCNFDCLYCELKAAKTTESYSEIIPLENLISEVLNALKLHPNIDVLTISANGEPTMYPHLLNFICSIKPHIPKHAKSLILSNGSLFGDSRVQAALSEFDIVKFSLDSIHPISFKKLDRPHKSLDFENIKNGIKSYAKIRQNELVCEILLVKNLNDDRAMLKELADFLREIKVDRIDLNTIDRPSAYKVSALNYDEIAQIAELFGDLNTNIPMRKNTKPNEILNLDEIGLIELLSRREISTQEAKILFAKSTQKLLEKLILERKIEIKQNGNVNFYVTISQN